MIGSVAVVRFDDGKANVLSLDALTQLQRHIQDGAARSRALLLVGRPGYLSAGLDRSVMTSRDREVIRQTLRSATDLYMSLARAAVPVVVACTGHALAGGALLLLSSDVRLAASGDWRIGLSEVRLGLTLPPLAVELARARLARPLLWRSTVTGEVFSPPEACSAGFIDEVVDPSDLESRALDWAAELSALDSSAVVTTRGRLWATEISAAGGELPAVR